MLQAKKKMCNGCNQQKHIWKADGRDKYCRDCWHSMEKPKTLKRVSPKTRVKNDEYGRRRLAFLAMHKSCQAGLVGCSNASTDVHHKSGRVGDNHLNMSTWLAVCRNCHMWIENNPVEAKEMGYSESRINKTTKA